MEQAGRLAWVGPEFEERQQRVNYSGATETRSYNNLLQLTNITATVQGGTGINVTYNYPTGTNNGKVSSVSDALSGETVTYQYDSLNRLISAAGSGWTQTQSYDGFGNLIGRVGTGTAQSTSMSTPADATTNRLSGYSYDANGNQLSTGNVFDAENRLAFANISGGMVEYFYDAQNKRVWQGTCTAGGNCQQGVVSTDTVTLFGVDGRLVGTYQWSAAWTNTQNQVALSFQGKQRAYFGGKLVAQSQSGVMQSAVQDRLGSVGRYYPYGEERNAPPLNNDQVKFATYTRDSGTGLDYADQRYYASTFGRFMTPDPYRGSIEVTKPISFNRYAYVYGDSVNSNDPTGLCIINGQEYPDPCFKVGNPPTSGGANSLGGGPSPDAGSLYIEPHFPIAGAPIEGAHFATGQELINLDKAIAKALEALKIGGCASLFKDKDGNPLKDANGRDLDPDQVLTDLAGAAMGQGNSTYGNILFQDLGADGTPATANGFGFRITPSGFSYIRSVILINTQFWGLSVQDDTTMLLHELGHVISQLSPGWFGSGNSFLSDAYSDSNSETNTHMVEDKCTRQISYP